MIEGFATKEKTMQFAKEKSLHNNHFSLFNNLLLSSIGIGTYLGETSFETNELYIESIVTAVEKGCNVIDTAINYRDMLSEQAVASAIKTLEQRKKGIRQSLFISTKVGYIPIDIRKGMQQTVGEYKSKGLLSSHDYGLAHSLNPKFIKHCIHQSLANLELETIDLLYLHNPETQLRIMPPGEFYSHITQVFETFESFTEKGKISMYGFATWQGFRVDAHSEVYLDLSRIVEAAEQTSAGTDHHFKAIQLPISINMPEAFLIKNQHFNEKNYSILELAKELGLSVFSSRTIDTGMPHTLNIEPLSIQDKIQIIRSLPGLTSTLVGMSKKKHVEENCSVLKYDKIEQEQLHSMFEEMYC